MNTTTPTEQDYQLIQRFFEFELKEEERVLVEERMVKDEAFLKKMQVYQQMDKQVDDVGKAKQQFAKEVQLQPKTNRKGRWTTLRAAAAMLVLAIGLLFVFQLFTDAKPDVLAQQYWENSEKITFSNPRDEQVNDEVDQGELTLIDASKSFDIGKFEIAFERLNSILPTDASYLKALLLKGQILFEQKRYEEAITHFQLIIDAKQSDGKDAAYWFQALSYLKEGKKEQAKSNLSYIIEQQYPTQGKAQNLLEKL